MTINSSDYGDGGAELTTNASTLFGTVDADALLVDLPENVAFHFHAAFGEVTITSAQTIGEVVDGDAVDTGVMSYIIPNGEQGFLIKNVAGQITVFYETDPEVIENLDHDTRYRIYATVNNATVQPAGDGVFPIDTKSVDNGNRFVTDNGDSTYTVTTTENPIKVTANYITAGITGTATRVYYIHETGQPNGTRVAGATDGVFGQGGVDSPASVVIPPNTTITVGIRSVSSGNNQQLQADSFLDFTEIIDGGIAVVTNAASNFRLSRHEDVTNLSATIVTGHDLTQAEGMTLKLFIRDQTSDRGWQTVDLDVDNIIETMATSTNDGFGLLFDNDYININVVDAATGEITFTQNGRDVEYVWSELWITAPTNAGIEEIANVSSLVTNGTFQNLGDASALYTGADGDRVHVEYGDTQSNRDTFVFLDGFARSERKGFGTNDIEIQVAASGQVQIRDLANANTVVNGWYEWKEGVVRTTKPIISNDCSVDIDDTGVNQDVSVNSIGINEFINNIAPYYIVLAHEGAGGNSKTVNVNGVAATFGNLQNATDSGGGVVSFSGGTNGNFNRRASTVETITKVGEYFDVITAATGQFDTQRIQISADPAIQANTLGQGNITISLAASGVTVFDENDVSVFTNGTENGTYRFKRTYFGFSIERNGVEVYASPEVFNDYSLGVDPIPDFSATIKGDILSLPDGRPYILLEDDATTTETSERTYDGATFPFVEVEFLRNTTATYAPYIRANSTGGRQSQVRINLNDGSFNLNNSGANTSPAIVHNVTVGEDTVRALIEYTDAVPHTDLEIAPAGATSALVNDPAQQGQTGVVGVTLYDSNPLQPKASDLIEDAAALATLNQLQGTTWQLNAGTDPANSEVYVNACEYRQVGNMRYYNMRVRCDFDGTIEFEVPNGEILTASLAGLYDLGAGSANAQSDAFAKTAGANSIFMNRDNDANNDTLVYGAFTVLML